MGSLTELISIANSHKSKIEAYQELSGAILCAKPSSGGWSMLEVIEHLNLTYKLYLPRIEKAITFIPALEEPLDIYRNKLSGKFMISGIKPRNGKRRFKTKTFKFFNPSSDLEIEKVFELYFQNVGLLLDFIEQCRSKDHGKGRVASAVGPIITFNLADCFEFLLAHEERHLVQADDIYQMTKNHN